MSGLIVVVTAAVIQQDGRFLMTRRLQGTHLAGAWEFPGGKCDPGESLAECLQRELIEELGTRAAIGREIFSVEHAYPERTVRLHFFETSIDDEPQALLGQEMRWVTRAELLTLNLPEADRGLVELLTGC
ncbi:MAG: (deoxy)nucleoside triphosphate pyrophosphohydrolase [Acidimicrobiia bacterium]|nr:(deoxy)nucleoside triphosphate pyrophosphohydrolase [Acidimicrobiia bacterium]